MLKQKNINIFFEKNFKRSNILFILASMLFICILFNSEQANAYTLPTAKGKVNAKGGVIIRELPRKSSRKVGWANNNASVKITDMVFATKSSAKKKRVWFHVIVNKKTGYIRSDLIDNLKFSNIKAKTTAKLNYRVGAGTAMKKAGSIKKGATVNLRLAAYSNNSPILWYRAKIKRKAFYVSSKYVNYDGRPNPDGKSDCARALLQKVSSGGKTRVVYKFNAENCEKRFYTKPNTTAGYGHVPQGMAFSGSKYYFIYAMDNEKQYIVETDLNGNNRIEYLRGKNGHLNGLTWDGTNNTLLIAKGSQYDIYTLNLYNLTFGKASTKPHSVSGVAYDSWQNYMIFSSRSAINVYKADGKYTFLDEFERCSRSGTYYVQDCCAQGGFVFHCISVGNKTGANNYIDVYRVKDGKYLGTIQVELGEIESAVINYEGYLEILINTGATNDYIWKTPLKAAELDA